MFDLVAAPLKQNHEPHKPQNKPLLQHTPTRINIQPPLDKNRIIPRTSHHTTNSLNNKAHHIRKNKPPRNRSRTKDHSLLRMPVLYHPRKSHVNKPVYPQRREEEEESPGYRVADYLLVFGAEGVDGEG